MQFREMKYILEVSRTGNIAQAAENLFISQPALRKALKQVESVYHAPLFYKEERRLLPTEIGKEIILFAQKMIEEEALLESKIFDIQHLQSGAVKLGVPSYIGNRFLVRKLLKFQKKYPKIKVEVYEGGGSELTNMVLSGDLDMALVMRPVMSDEINEICVIQDAVVCCVNSTHPFAEKPFLFLSDLQHTPFVTFNDKFNMPAILRAMFEKEGLVYEPAFTGEDPLFLFKYATLADYALILPYPMFQDFVDPDRHTVISFSPAFSWDISIISKKSSYTSYAIQTLLSNLIYDFRSLEES